MYDASRRSHWKRTQRGRPALLYSTLFHPTDSLASVVNIVFPLFFFFLASRLSFAAVG
jgi:hypothetical protein